jgi:hypothetical protein
MLGHTAVTFARLACAKHLKTLEITEHSQVSQMLTQTDEGMPCNNDVLHDVLKKLWTVTGLTLYI